MIKFILLEMTYLKYYMPLAIRLRERGVEVHFLIGNNQKYNDPIRFYKLLKDLFNRYEIKYSLLKDSKISDGTYITVEGAYHNMIPKSCKVLSLCALTDFRLLYNEYIGNVSYVVMSSQFMANYYKTVTEKNLYFGTTKYDIKIFKEDVLRKYKLLDKKRALVIFPRLRDCPNVDMVRIYNTLERMGYDILVKTRGKDKISDVLKRGKYFEDGDWYPHVTSELLEVSDIVINFDSTAIEEVVISKTPLVNFKIKTNGERGFDFLYKYDYCIDIESDFKKKDLGPSIEKLVNSNLNDTFERARREHLFISKDVSGLIVDFLNN